LCHICGVSFNIGRIRTPDEPRDAAWGRFGLPTTYPETYIDGGERDCHRNSGCKFAIRKLKDQNLVYGLDDKGKRKLGKKTEQAQAPKATDEVENEPEDDNDGDWTSEQFQNGVRLTSEEEDSDKEPMEYVSDDELLDSSSGHENDDVEMTDAEESDQEYLNRESLRQFWIQGLMEDEDMRRRLFDNSDRFPAWFRGVPAHFPSVQDRSIVDETFPLYYPGRDDASEHGSDASFEGTEYPESPNKWNSDKLNHWHYGKLGYHHEQSSDVEHIAGPGCESRNGYSGHEISAEEMRGCQTAQCLVRKPGGWSFDSLPDDESFETDGKFFLSGLTDHMPSRDYGRPQFTPPRHGCDEASAENCIWDETEAYDYALPFHPFCLEVFKRAQVLSYGAADVSALTSWWSLEADYQDFHAFPRDPNVSRCAEQDWSHHNGTAYLVANPLFVPRLEDILKAAIDTSDKFSARDGAFRALESTANVEDPFLLLPAELQFAVLDNLSSKDIASLRLSSRVFAQLPISYFHKLILREMPWLWEAWPTLINPSPPMAYSSWAAMTAYEAKVKLQNPQNDIAALNDYVDIVKAEMPELTSQLDEQFTMHYQALMEAEKRELALYEESRTPISLPPDRTNYFTLYTLITRHWPMLKGLQNRRRIWTDCEEILRRVEAYKKEGRIDDDGITEDLRLLVFERNRKRQEERRISDEQRAEERRLQAASNMPAPP
jgi:hypothetical protein